MSEPQLKKARHNEDMISFEDIFDANVIDEVNEYESEYFEKFEVLILRLLMTAEKML